MSICQVVYRESRRHTVVWLLSKLCVCVLICNWCVCVPRVCWLSGYLKVQSTPLGVCALMKSVCSDGGRGKWNENVFQAAVVLLIILPLCAMLRPKLIGRCLPPGDWLNELETSWVIFLEAFLQLVEHLSPGPHHELLVNHPLSVIFNRIDLCVCVFALTERKGTGLCGWRRGGNFIAHYDRILPSKLTLVRGRLNER